MEVRSIEDIASNNQVCASIPKSSANYKEYVHVNECAMKSSKGSVCYCVTKKKKLAVS